MLGEENSTSTVFVTEQDGERNDRNAQRFSDVAGNIG
jgi:hypothetical protein